MKLINRVAKIIIFTIFICAIGYLLYWLWQRQPGMHAIEKPSAKIQQSELEDQQKAPQLELNILPVDGTIVSENKVQFQGKINPNEYILIYSNSSQYVTNAKSDGKFQLDVDLEPGLNIIVAQTLQKDLTQNQSTRVSIYSKEKDDPPEINTLLSGNVKNIFDNLITLTTTNGEKTFRQKSSTKITLPEDISISAKKQNNLKDESIRIGDYLIALGTVENEKDFNALLIKLIRENKPQNTIVFTSSQFLTGVKQNLFSVKNLKDSKIIEFVLDKNSKILDGNQKTDIKNIIKDKKAIVFYQDQGSKNLVTSIYLLP